ncbi:unnamed protein product, partial [Chrysoparadoxa australica]
MTYEQADSLLRLGKVEARVQGMVIPGQVGGEVAADLQGPLAKDLWVLTHFARTCKRSKQEGVDLSGGSREFKFKLDPVLGMPISAEEKEDLEIHSTVAELMILANATVAEQILGAFPAAALLRTHTPVTDENLSELMALATAAGVPVEAGSNRKLQAILSGKGTGTQVSALLQSMATRAMSEAVYICSGTLSEHE